MKQSALEDDVSMDIKRLLEACPGVEPGQTDLQSAT